MRIDPESFRGKLYLLIADKLIIGAIIAVAFVAYDRWKTEEFRTYEDRSSEIQRDFERARLTRELVPVVVDPSSDVEDP